MLLANVVRYVAADVDADLPGTVTLLVVGLDDRGRPVRVVSTPALCWERQELAYAQSGSPVFDSRTYLDLIAEGVIVPAPMGG